MIYPQLNSITAYKLPSLNPILSSVSFCRLPSSGRLVALTNATHTLDWTPGSSQIISLLCSDLGCEPLAKQRPLPSCRHYHALSTP